MSTHAPQKPALPLRARYIDRADEADELLAGLADVTEVAIDTEGASYHRFVDRIYLLQLSARDMDVIIDPLSAGPLPGLVSLLADPDVEVVLHDADYDLRLLRQDYGACTRNIFDTRVAAQILGIKSFGLGALLERYFGVQLDKKYQRADWSLRPLTDGMLEYAVLDTHYLLRLRDRLRDELRERGRLSWAEEEFRETERQYSEPAADESETAFMRVKGARDLSRRELAVLRELFAWRESAARRLDRATFRVTMNETLLELARARPKAISALAELRGVSRVMVERDGSAVLAAIAAGEEVGEDQLPRFPRAPRWARDPDFDRRVDALRAAREKAAARLDMDPGVLCARERLEAIARANPRTIEAILGVPGVRRWQVEALGADLLKALQT